MIRRWVLSEYLVLLLSAGYFAMIWPFTPGVSTPENLANIVAAMLPLLVVALGQTFVLIARGIDLSVTSTIALASIAGAMVMNADSGWLRGNVLAVPVGITAMIATGALLGAGNGLAITGLRMPPFIVTLTTMMFVSGLAIWATRSVNVPNLPQSFIAIDKRALFGVVPYPLVIVAALAAAAQLMLSRTLMGRWLFAVGLNAKAARVSGVPVSGTVIFAYAFSGLCAGVGSVLYTARLRTGSPTLGKEILLDVIGAVVIGGTSLFGGKGSVIKTVFGVLFFALIANTLNWFDLKHAVILMVKGGVILLAAGLDLLRNKVFAAQA